jgi:polysaccharide biosynthesis PFTS motif protein
MTMRAYRKANLQTFRAIRERFVDAKVSEAKQTASKLVFGVCQQHADIVVKQLLIQRLAGGELTKRNLYQIGSNTKSLSYAMPAAWLEILEEHGFGVSKRKSLVVWHTLILKYWVLGLFTGLKILLSGVINTLQKREGAKKGFVHFMGLSSSNLPPASGEGYDILSWYKSWRNRRLDLQVRHDVLAATNSRCDCDYLQPPYLSLRGGKQLINYCCWFFKSVILSAGHALRGDWWNAFVLPEAIRAKAMSLVSNDFVAEEYFFHYSGNVYRPMWTYEAAKRGAQITCYFYSTSENISMEKQRASQRYEWGAANWPKYLVWDSYQEKTIRAEIDGVYDVEVVGPIYFASLNNELPALSYPSVAVFDVPPHRRSAHFGITTLGEYLRRFPCIQHRFLEDIYEVLLKSNVHMAVKQKRDIGPRGEKRYGRLLKQLEAQSSVTLVPPACSAIPLVRICQATISFPFTSTALYAQNEGRPSAYYDPMSWIAFDDPAARGLPVLRGRDELSSWIASVFD